MLLALLSGGIAVGQADEEVTIKEVSDLVEQRDALFKAAGKQRDRQLSPGTTPLSSLVAAFLLISTAAWPLTAVLRWMLLRLIAFSDKYRDTMQRFIRVPMRMFLFFTLVQAGVSRLGLSVETRAWLESGILSHATAVCLAMGIIEFAFASHLSRTGKRRQNAGIPRPLTTILKIVVVLIIILHWLNDAGQPGLSPCRGRKTGMS